MASITLFEDIFEITAMNTEGKKFEGVNRLQATGTTFECELLLDFNSLIYSLRESDKVTLLLSSTLHLDGSPAEYFSYGQPSKEPTLANNYDYVMHGLIFKVTWCRGRNWITEKDGRCRCLQGCGCDEAIHKKMEQFVIVALSFGGLLMRLVGEPRNLTGLCGLSDQRLYLLLKKD